MGVIAILMLLAFLCILLSFIQSRCPHRSFIHGNNLLKKNLKIT